MATTKKAAAKADVESFSIGDPEPVLGRRDLLGMLECWNNGRYYDPPVKLDALTRAWRVGPHHESAINYKVNILSGQFEETRWLDFASFHGFAQDFMVIGNGYLERVENRLGGLLSLQHPLGKYMRVGVEPGTFYDLRQPRQERVFAPGEIVHLKRPDINQDIYGLPEYLGALQSAFLNEAATLFRRKYYINGAHLGFILRSTDANMSNEEVEAIKTKMREGKGLGNFRNLFIHSPGGTEKGVQIIPINEVATKDEFVGIKNTSRDDVLAAHRVPPQLLGIVPANAGGFGDVEKASAVFERNEIKPLMRWFTSLNRQLGVEAIKFRPFAWELQPQAA